MRGPLRALLAVTGWVVIIVALDLGLGGLVGLVRDQPTDAPAGDGERSEAIGGPACLDASSITPENEANAADPAVRDAPWNREYWCEFGQLSGGYVPYLYYRLTDFHARHINSRDGVRRSYEPDGLGADAPVVWFFGGSTTWGYAQRDTHTIPSEVARVSEEAGTPVRVLNFGQLSWVHWQEMLAFEQELAVRDRPDVVVFYDGVNDVAVQTARDGRPSDNPTIYDFGTDPPAPVPPPFTAEAPESEHSLPERWADNSALWRLARTVGSWLGAPAEAAVTSSGQEPARPSSETSARRALDIYARGRALSLDVAREHDVQPIFFLQPRLSRDAASNAFIEGAAAAGPPTIDLTHVLGDSPSVFLHDSAHTNEQGARLVAEAMWPYVRQALGRASADG